MQKPPIPLADLEAENEKSANCQLLNDYVVWFVNYREEYFIPGASYHSFSFATPTNRGPYFHCSDNGSLLQY